MIAEFATMMRGFRAELDGAPPLLRFLIGLDTYETLFWMRVHPESVRELDPACT